MELASVKQIREKRDEIREKIKSLNLKKYSDGTFGDEKEYTFKGLIGGIEALLTDISTLTKYPSKFVKISTFTERSNISSHLTRIDTYLESPVNYLPQFEALKILLRGYNVRYFSDRQIEFESEIEEVRKIKLQLQQNLVDSKELNKKIDNCNITFEEKLEKSIGNLEEIEKQLKKIVERRDQLVEQSEILETINSNLDTIKETASENLEKITSSLIESKSNEKLITSFANKVQDREKRLDELEQKTEDNNTKLSEYEKERVLVLKEAEDLIESSKKALNYTTAEGISASFQNQYNNSNNKYIFGSWIVGAIICLIATVLLGIWILQTNPTYISLIIGRIALLPLPIIGAFFCANQYNKQKNIIEDYAYKMVLSKAIVGFSEQLKKNGSENNEEYVHYIKTALEEIHRDPLRKRDTAAKAKAENSNNLEILDIAERIIKIGKQ